MSQFDLNEIEHASSFIESDDKSSKQSTSETAETEFYDFDGLLSRFEIEKQQRKS